jgi:hypothetical protein
MSQFENILRIGCNQGINHRKILKVLMWLTSDSVK